MGRNTLELPGIAVILMNQDFELELFLILYFHLFQVSAISLTKKLLQSLSKL